LLDLQAKYLLKINSHNYGSIKKLSRQLSSRRLPMNHKQI